MVARIREEHLELVAEELTVTAGAGDAAVEAVVDEPVARAAPAEASKEGRGGKEGRSWSLGGRSCSLGEGSHQRSLLTRRTVGTEVKERTTTTGYKPECKPEPSLHCMMNTVTNARLVHAASEPQ